MVGGFEETMLVEILGMREAANSTGLTIYNNVGWELGHPPLFHEPLSLTQHPRL